MSVNVIVELGTVATRETWEQLSSNFQSLGLWSNMQLEKEIHQPEMEISIGFVRITNHASELYHQKYRVYLPHLHALAFRFGTRGQAYALKWRRACWRQWMLHRQRC